MIFVICLIGLCGPVRLMFSFCCLFSAGQVLPLPLSVDFLRLVLTVIDDQARSKNTVDVSSTAAASSDFEGEGATVVGASELGGSSTPHSSGTLNARHLFSVDDLPRLYHKPGLIIRKISRACQGKDTSRLVCMFVVGNGPWFACAVYFTFFVWRQRMFYFLIRAFFNAQGGRNTPGRFPRAVLSGHD